MWGFHLRLDLGDCNDNIAFSHTLKDWVEELVIAIDMKAFGEPQIVHFGKHDPKVAGYTLVQLIETSAITGHFTDHSGDAYIDVFSCKPFDIDVAVEVTDRHFRPRRVRKMYDERQA